MPSIAAFLSFACIMSFTPGPNNIMALSCASTYGLRKSLRFCFGVLLGVLGIMAACALFGATLFRFLPDVDPAMRAVGAAYILWMAFGIWRSKAGDEESRFAPTNGIVSGILLQLFNPKGMLYGMTAFSSFVLPYYDSFMPLAVSVAVLSLVAYVGACSWALFGAVFRRFLQSHHAAANAVMALLLVWCAVSLYV